MNNDNNKKPDRLNQEIISAINGLFFNNPNKNSCSKTQTACQMNNSTMYCVEPNGTVYRPISGKEKIANKIKKLKEKTEKERIVSSIVYYIGIDGAVHTTGPILYLDTNGTCYEKPKPQEEKKGRKEINTTASPIFMKLPEIGLADFISNDCDLPSYMSSLKK